MSIEPYLEVLREKVTGEKNASIRKYLKAKIKKLSTTQGCNIGKKESSHTRTAGRKQSSRPAPA